MVIHEIMRLQASVDEETRMSLLTAIHCAPILLGIKAANIMTVTESEFFRTRDLFRDTGISYCFLKMKGDTGILYLYRERELMRYLYSDDVQSFLKGYGYEIGDFQRMLEYLSDRIQSYNKGENAFPHEIGIFLEYPLMDVKGFLENEGKNFICSGYWKVYTDVDNTLRKFKEYDRVRERAIQAVLSGKKIREIVVEFTGTVFRSN